MVAIPNLLFMVSKTKTVVVAEFNILKAFAELISDWKEAMVVVPRTVSTASGVVVARPNLFNPLSQVKSLSKERLLEVVQKAARLAEPEPVTVPPPVMHAPFI